MEWLAGRLSGVEGIVAIALGGSHAQGTHRPDSDWDFGLYYRGTVDPDAIRALGYPGIVVAPGEWAYPMNGGAWLTVDGQKVDLLYRDLDDVERIIHEAEDGRWELHRVPGYLCGMPSYALLAELALGHVLTGTLPKPSFPDLLRESAPSRWRWEAEFALHQAEAHAQVDEIAACLGKLSFAVLAEAHARLCERGEWITNEKQLAKRGGVIGAERLLLHMSRRLELAATVNAVRTALWDDVDRARGDVVS